MKQANEKHYDAIRTKMNFDKNWNQIPMDARVISLVLSGNIKEKKLTMFLACEIEVPCL